MIAFRKRRVPARLKTKDLPEVSAAVFRIADGPVGAKFHRYTGEGGTNKREPAYADPTYDSIYLPRAKRFLKALADR